MTDLGNLPCRDAEGNVVVVVEAPRNSTVKLTFDPERQAFVYGRALPLGVAYPHDWGFVPSTRAADGDPLDAMVLADAPTWPGVVIGVKPIGVVRLVQRAPASKKKRVRNDRIIAVPVDNARYEDVHDLPKRTRLELQQFFVTVTSMTDKRVEIEGWAGAYAALELVDAAAVRYAHGRGAGRT